MSVFKKLKDVLFDIEEEEIPVITKEEKDEVEEEENPIKEIKLPKEEFHEEREHIKPKKETKFTFPMEDDFEDIAPSRVKRDYFDDDDLSFRASYKDNKLKNDNKKNIIEDDYSRFNLKDIKKEEVKTFKPSPVISPVYGILDQNYTKDDVIVKSDGNKRKDRALNLDDVRKKAYGKDEVPEPIKRIDEILEEENNDVVDNIKDKTDMTIMAAEENVNDLETSLPYDDGIKEETKPSSSEDDMESDLFNLIDSMYEEKNNLEEEND